MNLIVNSPSADLQFRSSDNVIFKVFRKHLQSHSEGFDAPAQSTISALDIVQLSESADVLEQLFRFMSNQPQPDMTALSFPLLMGLAEAAEKYQVYSALQLTKLYMGYVIIFLSFV